MLSFWVCVIAMMTWVNFASLNLLIFQQSLKLLSHFFLSGFELNWDFLLGRIRWET